MGPLMLVRKLNNYRTKVVAKNNDLVNVSTYLTNSNRRCYHVFLLMGKVHDAFGHNLRMKTPKTPVFSARIGPDGP